jgi:biofilm PGA synthesis N-glycosyltransferase PgaC
VTDSVRLLAYALVTPAHNEEATIERTIQSVVGQTTLPRMWVIVSDGSTDRTDEIVKRYADSHSWIEYVRLPEHRDRQFAAKVGAFNAGFERLRSIEYDIIGNLDADITFDPHYFEFLLARFAGNPRLGVGGTPFEEDGVSYDYRFTNIEHVSGACQLFRKECFHEIGGYQPIRGGGIDWVAVTTARMRGWQTRTFTEMVCHHHRKMGTGNTSKLGSYFRHGRKDYTLGGHPLWQLLRGFYQMSRPPVFVGGVLLILGYWCAALGGQRRPVSQELMRFHRKEQMTRLRRQLRLSGSDR